MAESVNYIPICLITALRMGLISSISSSSFVGSSLTSESDSPWWHWLARTHHLVPHSYQVCLFFIQDIFLGTVLVQ